MCGNEAFDCGYGSCIPNRFKCDGIMHCPNFLDEENCCQEGFLCGDGSCIQPWQVCNGAYDCKDGLDERSCGK